ncbi:MAG: hypothetical protein ACREQ5_31195 [Candidatus Dormibacteria bacterium]
MSAVQHADRVGHPLQCRPRPVLRPGLHTGPAEDLAVRCGQGDLDLGATDVDPRDDGAVRRVDARPFPEHSWESLVKITEPSRLVRVFLNLP